MTHDIKLRLPATEINSVDAEIEVRVDDRKLGVLHVSKGTVDWKPSGPSSWYSMGWTEFAKWMKENGKPTSSRES